MITTINYGYFNNFFKVTDCQKIIQNGKKNLTEGKTWGKDQQDQRKSKISWMNDFHLGQILYTQLQQANDQLRWNLQTTVIECIQFTSYGENDFYDWHRDNDLDKPFEEGYLKGLVRKISFSILLNDPADFQGGEFQFEIGNPNDKERIKTLDKPSQGGAIIFPSYLYHRVQPVTKGTRYSLVGWVCGQPWK